LCAVLHNERAAGPETLFLRKTSRVYGMLFAVRFMVS
jgi:hypothetical protein